MIYKGFLKQKGEGCGQKVISIEATNIDEAYTKLFDIIKGDYTGEEELRFCELYEINQTLPINLKNIYEQIIRDENALKLKEIEEVELKEFERLKRKFGR